jgi:hypothetical protein
VQRLVYRFFGNLSYLSYACLLNLQRNIHGMSKRELKK